MFFTIPLFFLWANTHGEFILGLGIMLIWMIFIILQEIYFNHFKLNQQTGNKIKIFFFVFCSAVFISCITPFGPNVYVETFRHFDNPMQKYLAEWAPVSLLPTLWN